MNQTVVDQSTSITTLTNLVDADMAEVHDLQQSVAQLNTTKSNLSAIATDYERRISTLEDEEVVNSGAIANNARDIEWNTANIALLNETIHNGTIPGNLTEQVNSNTEAIANLSPRPT